MVYQSICGLLQQSIYWQCHFSTGFLAQEKMHFNTFFLIGLEMIASRSDKKARTVQFYEVINKLKSNTIEVYICISVFLITGIFLKNLTPWRKGRQCLWVWLITMWSILIILGCFHVVVTTLGSILDLQLSWESGKFHARWSHGVVLVLDQN